MGVQVSDDRISTLIKDGKVFFLSAVLTAQSTPFISHWKTGSRPVHFVSVISAGLKTTITISKKATCSANGTEGNLFNRNGEFPDNAMLFKRYTAPTISSAGTLISTDQIGTSSAPGQSVQGAASESEGVLARNTSTILTITPSASTDITIDVLFWED